jgi:hypothetical protein
MAASAASCQSGKENDVKVFPEPMRATQRRHRRAGLALAAFAAAAAGFTMLASAPAAHADPVVLPDFPEVVSDTENGSTGFPPLWDGLTYSGEAYYTDLLGDSVGNSVNPESETFDVFTTAPGAFDGGIPLGTLTETEYFDDNDDVASLANGQAGGSTFDYVSADSGWNNYYELTPFLATNATTVTDNVNDTWLYDPTGLGTNDAGIDFGIQYVDLPDASTPVDAINVLGSGGDILFSIPVIGDLLSSF